MATARSLRNEVPFAFSLDDRVVHGVVDALYQSEKGQWVVVDFKTDRIKIEDVDKRTEEYLVQLGLYQTGMQMALGKPPQVIIYYLFPGAPIEIDGDVLLEARAKGSQPFQRVERIISPSWQQTQAGALGERNVARPSLSAGYSVLARRHSRPSPHG